MEWERIKKRPADFAGANLQYYERCVGEFSWVEARRLLEGLSGGLNIAHEAVDRHVIAGHGDKLALRWISRNDMVRDFSYAQLRAQSNRFACRHSHALAGNRRTATRQLENAAQT
jgi:acetyl-CoA synthetase